MNNKLNIQTKHKKMEKVRIRNRNILTKEVVTVGALGKKGFFEDPQSVTSQSRIKYDEMPFIITGERVYDCHHRHALTDMQQIKKEGILPRLSSLFFS